jgi:hypothetical protein
VFFRGKEKTSFHREADYFGGAGQGEQKMPRNLLRGIFA